jgi:GNAT superfamily N-acetyltransferase
MAGKAHAEPGAGAADSEHELSVRRVPHAELPRYVDELARLRIEVFREFPYLYEGSLDDERRYQRSFATSARSTLVLARVGSRVVGAATAMPLVEHDDATQLSPALARAGYAPEQVYYFGESVLELAQRGRGIGHAFFDQREQSARELGFLVAAFCAVERPSTHPARPSSYVPHDAFWTRRGFARRAELTTRFSWRDVGDAEETDKEMVFWLKELRP